MICPRLPRGYEMWEFEVDNSYKSLQVAEATENSLLLKKEKLS